MSAPQPTSLDAVFANKNAVDDAVPFQVANSDEPGMGHGKMGWLSDDPERFFSVAAERNKAVIGENVVRHLSVLQTGTVLEIGSGSGQHIAYLAKQLPQLKFKPTEYHGHPNPLAESQEAEKMLVSIRKTALEAEANNVLDAQVLDACELASWSGAGDGSLAAIICINVVHISPEAVLQGIVRGASKKLAAGGLLFFYGPWCVDGQISPESNIRFDCMLREKNPAFGIRDISSLARLCAEEGNLEVEERIFVEASNNYFLSVRKAGS